MRLLLIEDEVMLSEAMAYILKRNNYAVDTASDGETGQYLAETGVYDVIILDWMLPLKDGISILREIRKQGMTTPVILLTAKDAIGDRVQGLDAGADDYLVKPFATEELLARIRALSRRKNKPLQEEKVLIAGATFDPLQCQVTVGREKINLTLKESQILELLVRNIGQVFTKEHILDKVWGFEADVDKNIVEIHIHHLRRKLSTTNVSIDTIRGVGYCLKEG